MMKYIKKKISKDFEDFGITDNIYFVDNVNK